MDQKDRVGSSLGVAGATAYLALVALGYMEPQPQQMWAAATADLVGVGIGAQWVYRRHIKPRLEP